MERQTTHGGGGGTALEELRDRHETASVDVLCLRPEALMPAVERARAALRSALVASRETGTDIVRAALAELSGVPGAAALEARQQLSRTLHRLLSGETLAAPPEAGPLGPVQKRCDVCDEWFDAPRGRDATQQTTCPRCRRAGAVREETPVQEETRDNGPETTDQEPAAPAQAETTEPEGYICPGCHVPKRRDAEHFSPDPRSRDGLRKKCKQCQDATAKAGWEKRRNGKAAQETTGVPTGPDLAKELAEVRESHGQTLAQLAEAEERARWWSGLHGDLAHQLRVLADPTDAQKLNPEGALEFLRRRLESGDAGVKRENELARELAQAKADIDHLQRSWQSAQAQYEAMGDPTPLPGRPWVDNLMEAARADRQRMHELAEEAASLKCAVEALRRLEAESQGKLERIAGCVKRFDAEELEPAEAVATVGAILGIIPTDELAAPAQAAEVKPPAMGAAAQALASHAARMERPGEALASMGSPAGILDQAIDAAGERVSQDGPPLHLVASLADLTAWALRRAA